MAKRVCDACGKSKELSWGKACEKGHFICSSCAKQQCPLCKKRLR